MVYLCSVGAGLSPERVPAGFWRSCVFLPSYWGCRLQTAGRRAPSGSSAPLWAWATAAESCARGAAAGQQSQCHFNYGTRIFPQLEHPESTKTFNDRFNFRQRPPTLKELLGIDCFHRLIRQIKISHFKLRHEYFKIVLNVTGFRLLFVIKKPHEWSQEAKMRNVFLCSLFAIVTHLHINNVIISN